MFTYGKKNSYSQGFQNVFNVREAKMSEIKRAPISDVVPRFIEVGCLKNKLNRIRYELDCVIIPKNLK